MWTDVLNGLFSFPQVQRQAAAKLREQFSEPQAVLAQPISAATSRASSLAPSRNATHIEELDDEITQELKRLK